MALIDDLRIAEARAASFKEDASVLRERQRQAKELCVAVPQILDGAPVPHQVLQGFALMVEGLLIEEES